MDDKGQRALQKCWVTLVEELDPFSSGLVHELQRQNILSETQVEALCTHLNRRTRVRKLLHLVIAQCDFETFQQALGNCYEGLVLLLLDAKASVCSDFQKTPNSVSRITDKELDMETSKVVHALLHIIYDENQDRYYETVNAINRNRHTCDLMYAIHDSMLTFCTVHQDWGGFNRKGLATDAFDKLNKNLTSCINQTAATFWFLMRKAVMLALDKDYREAFDTLQQGVQLYLYALAESRTIQFAIILQVYALHTIWEDAVGNPYCDADMIVSDIDTAMERGIEHVMRQYQEDNQKYFYLRLLYLRWAFIRLGISRSGHVKLKRAPDKGYVKEAGKFLDQVDKYWCDIECRQKMFYYVARSVYWRNIALSSEGSLAKARNFAVLALKEAQSGSFEREELEIKSLIEWIKE